MAINPYFKEYRGEQDLLNDLTIETIKTMGRDMIYIPREYVNKDLIFGEDTLSEFKYAYTIEMYIQNVTAFGGQMPKGSVAMQHLTKKTKNEKQKL